MDINKDYTNKILSKLLYNSNIMYWDDKNQLASDFNNFINMLNYCFAKRNNFFISNFNKKNLIPICIAYNQIKTNILTPDILDLFNMISIDGLKSLRFIVTNAINNYRSIRISNEELFESIPKMSLKRCLILINSAINQLV